jgi:predicted FMN-binding regulatory protein PaiB
MKRCWHELPTEGRLCIRHMYSEKSGYRLCIRSSAHVPLLLSSRQGPGGLLANLVPFTLVDGGEKGILRAHIAKANDQVDALSSGAETLIVFQGPEAYITPSWYVSKREHGRVVPTWNYAVVQARNTACGGRSGLATRTDW